MLGKAFSQKLRIVLCVVVLLVGALTILIAPIPVSAGTQATYYASPTGSGTTCSLASPCSLDGAHTQVLTVNGNMTGDIIVYLRGGTYTLSSTFQLTESGTVHDSGTNGYNVIYEAYPGETPVISGGQTITGWSLYDSGKNIYRANVGTSLNTRQLYVNGVRATRARGVSNPAGFTQTSTGYTAPSTGTYANMSTWGNQSNIEIFSNHDWMSDRCAVSSISGSAITMTTPCWTNTHRGPTTTPVTWVENAYELLTTAGQWYLDRTAGYLYYIPYAGDTMTTDTVITPTLETLVSATGAALSTPIHNIQFIGITFSYATWLRPSTTEGYASYQSTFTLTGSSIITKTPAPVTFHTAQNILMQSNTFTHLGSTGLVFEFGSQNNTILGNTITDISGSGIIIGDVDHPNPTDSREQTNNNTVKDNYIHNVGVEYNDGVGVFAGYTNGTIVTHNDIEGIPYTGVSVGWGWGTNSYAQNNQITNNLIDNVMTALVDGGGVYVLSDQPNSTITNNYIHDLGNRSAINALYLDNGTRHYNVNNNVVRNTTNWLQVQANIPDAEYNTVQYNYTDTTNTLCCGANNTINNNTTDGVNSTTVLNIMNNAGLEAAYQYLKPGNAANLALNKPAKAYYIDGSVATMQPGSTPGYAVDGDTSTGAQAYGQYRWQEQVDLLSIQPISEVKVTMGSSSSYATDFNINVSTDGTNFTTVRTVSGFAGGISDQTFAATYARYVRIVAVKPDGPNQTGGQMAISELEVYPYTRVDTRVDDGGTGASYTGSWTTNADSNLYGGNQHYTVSTNDYVQFTFSGTAVDFAWTKDVNRGKGDVYIDGVFQQTVDFYSPTTQYQQILYSKSGLSSGSHTLKIINNGTKNPSSSGYNVGVDFFDYTSPLTRVDDGGTGVSYTGSGWTTGVDSNLYGGNQHYTSATNDYVQFTFNGTSVDFAYTLYPNRGKGDVYIDGVFQQTVDFYSPTLIYQNIMYTISGLSSGSHTLKIVNNGTKNANSTGYTIGVDFFDYSSALTRVDDGGTGVSYTGAGWTQSIDTNCYGVTQHYTSTTNDYVQFTFTGTSFDFAYTLYPNRGKGDVYIDGVFQQTVDFYWPNLVYQNIMYTKSGLSSGSHTLKIVNNGTKNASSSGYSIGVDFFDYQ